MSSLWNRLSLEIDGFVGRLFHYATNEPWRSEHPELRGEHRSEPRPSVLEPAAETPEIEPPATDEQRVIDALAALGGGATFKEITHHLQEPAGWLRPQLKSLTDKGTVRRVGEKLRTRYEWVEP